MGKSSYQKVLLFFAAIISAIWFMDLSAAADGADLGSLWGGFTVMREWSWLAIVFLLTATIVYVGFPFLRLKVFTSEWWLYLAWLIAALISVLFIGTIYLAASKCGYTIQKLFSSIPEIWLWLWAFAISLMLPLTIMGIVLGNKQTRGRARWDVAEKIIMGIVSIWSCYLSTFGITIWNIFSFCSS